MSYPELPHRNHAEQSTACRSGLHSEKISVLAKKKQQKGGKDSTSFEEALAELESVVNDLENGDLGLAEALERYELGVSRLKQCQKLLEKAEQRIEVLIRVDAQGNAITRPLEKKSLEKKKRGRKRSDDHADGKGPSQTEELDETDDIPETADVDDLHRGPERGLF